MLRQNFKVQDIDPMIEYGVPVMGLSTQPDVDVNGYSNYFDIHHRFHI